MYALLSLKKSNDNAPPPKIFQMSFIKTVPYDRWYQFYTHQCLQCMHMESMLRILSFQALIRSSIHIPWTYFNFSNNMCQMVDLFFIAGWFQRPLKWRWGHVPLLAPLSYATVYNNPDSKFYQKPFSLSPVFAPYCIKVYFLPQFVQKISTLINITLWKISMRSGYLLEN